MSPPEPPHVPPAPVSGIEDLEPRADQTAMDFDFAEVLRRMVEAQASDVHLTPGFPPAMRDKGKIVRWRAFRS